MNITLISLPFCDYNELIMKILGNVFHYHLETYGLNTIAGRSLNNLSQYFIFPWIIHDFIKDIVNWLNNSIYRDLSLTIYACGEDKERILNNYNLLDEEKYHIGTFYSTHSFVCYFLVRQRPFTEIHLKIQGSIESDRISQKLNLWIDLIFGYKQIGQNAIKSLNIYCKACYSFTSKTEFEKTDKNNELESYLYEKEELGCIGKQLFTNSHKSREINN